ncbi:hypothetical protein C8C92_3431 [Janthinobacterium sp. 78]|nr:hypothetical protein C8C92_3431 [Janthinobacterium sp. 78]
MMKNLTSDKRRSYRDEPIATTVMDSIYANGAAQPRLFSEGEL